MSGKIDKAAPPHAGSTAYINARIVDPTGVGDAFRGGLMKGLAMGLTCAESARIGSVAATYVLEPPCIQVLDWREGAGLTSHLLPIGDYPPRRLR